MLVVNLAYWFAVIVFPGAVYGLVSFLNDWTSKGLAILLGGAFGAGVCLTYALFRFKFPDLENTRKSSGSVMASYSEQQAMDRRIRVWLVSVTGGVLNLLGLWLLELLRLYGR